jgi:hypothetical protein
MKSRIMASKSIANGDTGVSSHSRRVCRPCSVIEYTVRGRFPTYSRLAAASPMASSRLTSR